MSGRKELVKKHGEGRGDVQGSKSTRRKGLSLCETQPVNSLTRVEPELGDVEVIRQDVPSQIWHFFNQVPAIN